MRMLATVTTSVMAMTLIAAPAAGQSLADRIAHVRKKQAEKANQERHAGFKFKALQALLYIEVDAEFNETPVRDVMEFLETALGVNLIVRYQTDSIIDGIDPETPITLEEDSIPALDLLELVLDQCGTTDACSWQLRKSYVEIGTKCRLSVDAAQEVRFYPIDELIYEPPHFDNAPSVGFGPYGYYGYPGYSGYYGGGSYGTYPQVGGVGGAIRATTGGTYTQTGGGSTSGATQADRAQDIVDLVVELVEPQAWSRNGGDQATIRFHEGALIVRAPDFIHRQIAGYPRVPPPPRPDEITEPEDDAADAADPGRRH